MRHKYQDKENQALNSRKRTQTSIATKEGERAKSEGMLNQGQIMWSERPQKYSIKRELSKGTIGVFFIFIRQRITLGGVDSTGTGKEEIHRAAIIILQIKGLVVSLITGMIEKVRCRTFYKYGCQPGIIK